MYQNRKFAKKHSYSEIMRKEELCTRRLEQYKSTVQFRLTECLGYFTENLPNELKMVNDEAESLCEVMSELACWLDETSCDKWHDQILMFRSVIAENRKLWEFLKERERRNQD